MLHEFLTANHDEWSLYVWSREAREHTFGISEQALARSRVRRGTPSSDAHRTVFTLPSASGIDTRGSRNVNVVVPSEDRAASVPPCARTISDAM